MDSGKADRSIREDIYETMRDDITFGHFMPGERLTEKKLSDIYKASRSPIREALRQLESEGLISFERNKGIEVSKPTIKQVEEIFNIRELLEGYSVRLSVGQMNKKDVGDLTRFHKNLIRAARDNNIEAWLQNNSLFHGYFRDKADNENLSQLIIMLRRRTYHYQTLSFNYSPNFETYIGQHAAILDACEKKDSSLAERLMRFHIQTIKIAIVKSLSMNHNFSKIIKF
jgi:DNA-binding GntR family transcriptional regulator